MSARSKSKISKRRSQDRVVRGMRLVSNRTQVSVDPNNLFKEIPLSVFNSISRKTPDDIVQTKSNNRDKGFDTLTWNDSEGSKLYVNNLQANGKFGAQTDQTLATILPGSNSGNAVDLSTIYIQTGSDNDSRFEALKIVHRLANNLSDDEISYVVTASADASQLNDNQGIDAKMVLGYSLTAKVNTPLLSDRRTFEENMGEVPKSDKTLFGRTVKKKSTLYKSISDSLDNFHRILSDIDKTTFRIEKGDRRLYKVQAEPKARLSGAAAELQSAITGYIDNSKTKIFDKESKQKKSNKKEVVQELEKQVNDAIADNFKTELDRVRINRWQNLSPLTEQQIIPGTAKVIGSGAQGDVTAHLFRLNPDDVQGQQNAQVQKDVRFAVKLDEAGLNGDAIDAGIPTENPQQSARAVAAYALSKHLSLNIVPQTRFVIMNDVEGRPQLGQALEFVDGTVGQREGLDKTPLNSVEDAYIIGKLTEGTDDKLLAGYTYQQGGHDVAKGWYKKLILPVDINYDSIVVQKGFSDLQLFDAIIGHADRNPGNWIYERNVTGDIIGIKAIDNDDAFGSKWRATIADDPETSKTPGIPPVIDMDTALKILNFDSKTIETELHLLTDEERTAAVGRLENVKREIIERMLGNQLGYIATSEPFPPDAQKRDALKRHAGMAVDPTIKSWHAADGLIGNAHIEGNSYLGNVKAQKRLQGVSPIN